MLGKILCKLGIHQWLDDTCWYPSFDAPIITRYEGRLVCGRCGKVDEVIFTYDEVTGQPLDIIQNGVVTKYADI